VYCVMLMFIFHEGVRTELQKEWQKATKLPIRDLLCNDGLKEQKLKNKKTNSYLNKYLRKILQLFSFTKYYCAFGPLCTNCYRFVYSCASFYCIVNLLLHKSLHFKCNCFLEFYDFLSVLRTWLLIRSIAFSWLSVWCQYYIETVVC